MQSPRLGTMAGGQSRTGARREDNRTAAAPASTFCCLSVFLERRVASCEALYRGAIGGSGPRETALSFLRQRGSRAKNALSESA